MKLQCTGCNGSLVKVRFDQGVNLVVPEEPRKERGICCVIAEKYACMSCGLVSIRVDAAELKKYTK